jgi:IS1 family transposase
MRLGIRVGEACAKMLDETMRGLTCQILQIDEIWSFVMKKQRFVTPEEEAKGFGDIWGFIALDQETRLVPAYLVGKRDYTNTALFAEDLASRMKNRVRIYSDGSNAYISAIEEAFGDDVEYGQIVKRFTSEKHAFEERKYSPPKMEAVSRRTFSGEISTEEISTSHIEAKNNLVRTHMKRMMRLTNGHSKKLENLKAAFGLHFAYYNFCRNHGSIRMTPAMAHGLASSFWQIGDLVALTGTDGTDRIPCPTDSCDT